MLLVTRIGQAVFAAYDTSFSTANYNFVHRKDAKGALPDPAFLRRLSERMDAAPYELVT
jgi:hypothetical protein